MGKHVPTCLFDFNIIMNRINTFTLKQYIIKIINTFFKVLSQVLAVYGCQ